jgi:cyclopropane-fatty-acyl-phospholipid synthase
VAQGRFIAARAPANLSVVTADMNDFAAPGVFDRVVSVEMFEHMRNWPELMRRISGWLITGGKLFVHVFCHRRFPYPFDTDGAGNWMGRHFFTGGIMPSADLLPRFQEHLQLEEQWAVDGAHYARTAEAWLANLDARRGAVLPILAAAYGPRSAARWHNRWRLFFLACAECFGYEGGSEWQVAHYRFMKAIS